jgi:hypothetical protein
MRRQAWKTGRGAHALGLLLLGTVLGALPAALYAGLVGAIHFALRGRLDRVPTFALICLVGGALVGLLVGAACALAGHFHQSERPTS